ncbi:6-phosphogluconolactonase [Conchiformibius kuhniae]|uniref:6-phosphogluconolactonase n=1 Tax=Conchiformibius kuhniae TaxID=211502 RepID=A0A8T9MSE7_9NEIS|nr:6-phosphogluconolactonase [Conchiformibius kuhniae]UOP04149.1 6-phosphogluconolactonase [Conchiformibius kuhniae]
MEVRNFSDAAQAASALADAAASALNGVLARQPRATLAVSGGRSPITFFHALRERDVAWARVNLTLADERIVPTTHADSNTALVREHLLQGAAAQASWLALVADGAKAEDLRDAAAVVAAARARLVQPDVVVLGMGADGHTASLFPHAPQLAAALAPDAPLVLHTSPMTAPHERISMSLSAICGAGAVFLAIGGAEKLAVFRRAAEGVCADLPVSRVLHDPHTRTRVFCHD